VCVVIACQKYVKSKIIYIYLRDAPGRRRRENAQRRHVGELSPGQLVSSPSRAPSQRVLEQKRKKKEHKEGGVYVGGGRKGRQAKRGE